MRIHVPFLLWNFHSCPCSFAIIGNSFFYLVFVVEEAISILITDQICQIVCMVVYIRFKYRFKDRFHREKDCTGEKTTLNLNFFFSNSKNGQKLNYLKEDASQAFRLALDSQIFQKIVDYSPFSTQLFVVLKLAKFISLFK